jgi:argininosuccinate lyase
VHTVLDALDAGLELLVACLRGATIDTDRLAARAATTDTTATELADELVRTGGRPFPEAHRTAAALVRRLADQGRPLATATPDDLLACGGPPLPAEVLAEALAPAAFVARRNGLGGPAPESVRSQIERARSELAEYHRAVDLTTARIDAAYRTLRTPGKDVNV